MEEVEKVNEDFNVKKPKKKGLIIGGIILLVLIIVAILGVVYFLTSSKPEKLFNSYIDKLFASETEEYNSVKMSAKMKISGELEDSDAKQVFEEIGKCALKIGAQADFEKRQEIVDLGLEYDKDSVIDAKIYYDDGKVYAHFDEIFDKYIEIDMEEYQKEALKEIFETADEKQIKNTQKAMKIVRDELKAELKEQGEFEKEQVELDIGDKEEKVTKNTLTLSQKELYNLIANVCSNLAKNDDFLDCFEESPKDMLKEIVEDIKDEETDSKNNIKISIYTKGITNKFVGMDISVNAESNSQTQTITFTVLKEDKDVYSYTVGMKSSYMKVDLINGKIEIEKEKDSKNEQEGKAKITMEIAEMGKISLEMTYSAEFNKGIDKIDVSNSVKMDDIKESDLQGIMKKLMERPLIGDLIKEEIGSTSISGSTVTKPNTTTTTTPNNTTTAQNVVEDKNYGYSVKYSIPTGFEYDSDYAHDYRKYYTLDNDNLEIDASVSLGWYRGNEYEEDINDDYNYYKDSTYYKNASLGDVKTLKVGDNEFNYQIITYEADSEYYEAKYQKAYVWYRLDDEYIFAVELELDSDTKDGEITEDIIKGFLNIEVTKLK